MADESPLLHISVQLLSNRKWAKTSPIWLLPSHAGDLIYRQRGHKCDEDARMTCQDVSPHRRTVLNSSKQTIVYFRSAGMLVFKRLSFWCFWRVLHPWSCLNFDKDRDQSFEQVKRRKGKDLWPCRCEIHDFTHLVCLFPKRTRQRLKTPATFYNHLLINHIEPVRDSYKCCLVHNLLFPWIRLPGSLTAQKHKHTCGLTAVCVCM